MAIKRKLIENQILLENYLLAKLSIAYHLNEVDYSLNTKLNIFACKIKGGPNDKYYTIINLND